MAGAFATCRYPGCKARCQGARHGLCRDHIHAVGVCACSECLRRAADARLIESSARWGLTASEAAVRLSLPLPRVRRIVALYKIAMRGEREARCQTVARRGPVGPVGVPRGPDPLAAIYHPRWSPADDLLLLRERAAGRHFVEIAADTDRGVAEVQQRWHRLRAVRGIEALLKAHIKGGADADAPWPDPSEVAA